MLGLACGAMAGAEDLEEFPLLPGGTLDRRKICLVERAAYEACFGTGFANWVRERAAVVPCILLAGFTGWLGSLVVRAALVGGATIMCR